jgi:hypothetical protein
VPNFVKSVPRGSILNESLLIKSPAHQLEALAGTTTEGAETAGAASIQIPPSTAVDGLRTAGTAIVPPSAEFDGTRKIETKTANAAEPESIATRSADATRVVGSAAVATAVSAETSLAGIAALAVGADSAGRSEDSSADAPRAALLTCMATHPAERQLLPGELATLRRRGNEFIANGIIAAAGWSFSGPRRLAILMWRSP